MVSSSANRPIPRCWKKTIVLSSLNCGLWYSDVVRIRPERQAVIMRASSSHSFLVLFGIVSELGSSFFSVTAFSPSIVVLCLDYE